MKNLDDLIKESVRKSLNLQEEPKKEVLDEAYVAQPKVYTQVSEFSSQKTKEAHDRLYKETVSKLNEISAKIDGAVNLESNAVNSQFRSLKLDEVNALNSVYFHELFFANCFDPHSEIFSDTMPYLRLQRDFGTFEDWQKDFTACALSSREGWAVTGYNTFLKRYVNTIIDGHSNNVMVGLIPIIVVDMWSHSYYRDYLDDKESYLISKMRELNWEVIEERILKAEKIHEALK